MSILLSDLFDALSGIAPSDDESVLYEIILDWRGRATAGDIRRSVHSWLESGADKQRLRMLARETSTHHVWPIYATNSGFGVAIHEFKDPDDMVAGHAAIFHNHRYSFASLMLSGGYRQIRSNIELVNDREAVRIQDVSDESVITGDIVRINHEEFHRLSAFETQTVTLVAKCPAAKTESFSVDSGTLRVTWHVPVEQRVPQLMATLLPMNEMES